MKKLLVIALLSITAACSKSDDSRVDDALSRDLTMAASRPAMDTIGQAERMGTNSYAAGYNAALAEQQQPVAPRRTATRRTSSRTSSSRTAGRTSSAGSSSSGVYTAPRTTTVVKHTKRDAAIGAGAGAVIGAVTSHDKVKGAVVGGVVGAVIGGVLGNNVDKSRR